MWHYNLHDLKWNKDFTELVETEAGSKIISFVNQFVNQSTTPITPNKEGDNIKFTSKMSLRVQIQSFPRNSASRLPRVEWDEH